MPKAREHRPNEVVDDAHGGTHGDQLTAAPILPTREEPDRERNPHEPGSDERNERTHRRQRTEDERPRDTDGDVPTVASAP